MKTIQENDQQGEKVRGVGQHSDSSPNRIKLSYSNWITHGLCKLSIYPSLTALQVLNVMIHGTASCEVRRGNENSEKPRGHHKAQKNCQHSVGEY